MDVAVFSTKPYDRRFLDAANAAAGARHRLAYFEARLSPATAVLATGAAAVCLFVNDQADEAVLDGFSRSGVRLVALRSAGFNNVDLAAARRLGVSVARVPAYSPDAVAEHTVAMVLSLNRAVHRAYARVREGNFALEGLLGFDLKGRTVGVVGTGRIGAIVARIMMGFGCRVVAHDPAPAPGLRGHGRVLPRLGRLLAASDIVTLHCPLTPGTRHLIDAAAIARMKRRAMLVNTSRGGLVDTRAVIAGLKSGAIGHLVWTSTRRRPTCSSRTCPAKCSRTTSLPACSPSRTCWSRATKPSSRRRRSRPSRKQRWPTSPPSRRRGGPSTRCRSKSWRDTPRRSTCPRARPARTWAWPGSCPNAPGSRAGRCRGC
jgi:D-lactate dehydrogenase